MKALHVIAPAALALCASLTSSAALAQVTVYDNQAAFVAATGAALVPIPDSDTVFPMTNCGGAMDGAGAQLVIAFAPNQVTISRPPGGGTSLCIFDAGEIRSPANTDPNVMIANTVIGNGEDDYLLVFDVPVSAVGFRFLTNFSANELVTLEDPLGNVISVENIDALTPANTRQFVGFHSTTPIKTVFIDTLNGGTQNEGFDELKVAGPSSAASPMSPMSPTSRTSRTRR